MCSSKELKFVEGGEVPNRLRIGVVIASQGGSYSGASVASDCGTVLLI